MSNDTNTANAEKAKIAALIKEKNAHHDRQQEAGEKKIREVFPDQDQADLIVDLFKNLFINSINCVELLEGGLRQAAISDAFYSSLVGENKIISQESFDTDFEDAVEALKQSMMEDLADEQNSN